MCGCADVRSWMCGCADLWIFGFLDVRRLEVGSRIFGKQRLDKHLIKTELSIGAAMASEAIHPEKDG